MKFTVFEEKVETYPLAMLIALGASKDTIKYCYKAFPKALKFVDRNIGCPLHYAAEFEGAKDVIEFLGKEASDAFLCVDRDDRTPLHHAAVSEASYPTIAAILAGNPKALLSQALLAAAKWQSVCSRRWLPPPFACCPRCSAAFDHAQRQPLICTKCGGTACEVLYLKFGCIIKTNPKSIFYVSDLLC